MLGNFSFGDYFKQGAVEMAWQFSLEELGFDEERVWITVFEGDDELGLGPDEEAIEAWKSVGVPRERIVLLPRSENFWQAGATGPCGPCSELYYDRGLDFGAEDDLPGGDNERFLEYWNLVFMQYDQEPEGVLTPLPAKNIDTGLGLERQAMLQQGTDSIYETDNFLPLIQLGEQLSGRTYHQDADTDRALRILADHSRGMSFLIADGVVPSNEDRGYVLRRIMRRAILQGRRIGIEPGFLPRFAARRAGADGRRATPSSIEQADTIDMWLAREEEAFGQTLEQGTRILDEHIARAKDRGAEGIGAAEAFQLHDTYGFPFDLTRRARRRAGAGRRLRRLREPDGGSAHARPRERGPRRARRAARARAGVRRAPPASAPSSPATRPSSRRRRSARSRTRTASVLAKLVESPFYATGGGQVHDEGVVECEGGGCSARVKDVLRLDDDQVLVLEPIDGEIRPDQRVVAKVDRGARRATECNHTATHLLHAALRERLGSHVRQAGSYVGPDKLRFDFTHGAPLSVEDVRAVEDRVNEWVLSNQPVRALTTTLDEARNLGAMALFGEKYGDVVRMVEVGDGQWSRELCGGTHVRATAEIGAFKITTETSSAANVRRIEAITGPVAIGELRESDRVLADAAKVLRTQPHQVAEIAAEREAKRRELEKGGAKAEPIDTDFDRRPSVDGVQAVVETKQLGDPKLLPELADKIKGKLGDPAVVVLGVPGDGKVNLLVAATPGAIERGVKAGDVVRAAAQVVGGGGGGRDNMAQAGGRDPDKLPEALDDRARGDRAGAARGERARRRARLRQRALRRRRLRSHAHARHAARAAAAAGHPQGLRPPDRPDRGAPARDGARRAAALAVGRRHGSDARDPCVRPAVE